MNGSHPFINKIGRLLRLETYFCSNFLNSFFNRGIFVNLKESIFFAQDFKPFWSIVYKNSIVLYKEVTNITYGKNCSDNLPKPFTKLSMFCVLADHVPSLLPFSTVPATVMLALPVLHRSAQYHKLSCFFQPSPFVLSYYALSCPVLSVPHKLMLTPTFCPSPPILPTYLSCPYQAALSFNDYMAFLFPAPLRTFIAALPCPTC